MKKIVTNNYFIFFLKLFIGITLIIWLKSNNKLDLNSSLSLFFNYSLIIPAFILILSQVFISALRWNLILRIHSNERIELKKIFLIQWIGYFFSSFLPGIVTGDVIKLGYAKSNYPSLTKSFLLLSIFLDRLVGLIGLLLISGIGSLIFYKELLTLNPKMYEIIYLNLFFLLGALTVLCLFFIPTSLLDSAKGMRKIHLFQKIINALFVFKENKTLLLKLILLSVLAHSLSIFAFHLINLNFYQSTIHITEIMTLIPIGQVTIAIPISPSGLGVGHLAYAKLFSFIHQNNGATLFNNFWLISLSVYLLGFIPFIFFKKKS